MNKGTQKERRTSVKFFFLFPNSPPIKFKLDSTVFLIFNLLFLIGVEQTSDNYIIIKSGLGHVNNQHERLANTISFFIFRILFERKCFLFNSAIMKGEVTTNLKKFIF
jgi:hypothetical protein